MRAYGPNAWIWLALALPLAKPATAAKDYDVGLGEDRIDILDVPWENLAAGDRVRIHWRAEPYAAKWVIEGRGSADRPILVEGVRGPDGQRPRIQGDGAQTRTAQPAWNPGRSVIRIGYAQGTDRPQAGYIKLQGLEVLGARAPATYFDAAGTQGTYTMSAAAVHVDRAVHVEIRDCVLRDSANGVFVGSDNEHVSEHIRIEGCHLRSNGIVGSSLAHNSYTAALGMTYRFNRFGPLVAGSIGNNLKDRSAGLNVTANWIEGGNRQLDLVDGVDSVHIRTDPSYAETRVMGNVIVDLGDTANNQVIHYGGDQEDPSAYRQSTLHFYSNTVVSKRTGPTTLLRLASNAQRAQLHNNIVFCSGPKGSLALVDDAGTVELRNNWLQQGWKPALGPFSGILNDDESGTSGTSPGFRDPAKDDYHLKHDSPCRAAAAPQPAKGAGPPWQFLAPLSASPRNSHLSLGAYEYAKE